ncbi:MAG: glycosyltransferase family 4 protein [Colwellia sp.]|jgi:Glycosyltransferase
MKILLFSSASSVHTIRWANALASKVEKLILVSQHDLIDGLSKNVVFYKLQYTGIKGYFLNAYEARKIIKAERPDVVHAHFASGYGALAKNCGHPYMLSVWGSDVYDFPNEGYIKKLILKRSLKGASKLFSTSHCMKKETQKFTNKPISVIPFGVNVSDYQEPKSKGDMVSFGVVKVLDFKYGIDVLLDAFAIVSKKYPNTTRLVVAGDGPLKAELEAKAKKLGVGQYVDFMGWVNNREIPSLLASLDIFVVPSRLDSESFGVVAVEAGAAKLPCIVSNVGGLPEVVLDGKTGFVVPKEDVAALANKMLQLYENKALRVNMGLQAFANVSDKYVWSNNVDNMVANYREYTGV